MSYQVLARKWRPHSFADMAGQEHVLRALVNALDQGRLHQAYLFTGTRGVGKTTLARILAKALNCERGVSAEPCGECSACAEVDAGRFIDLIEVDAASRTKVEDTRELLDNVQYSPTRGRYKIYLIDEVHMLSAHSFNALLKTLEEPPPHVKFLLATTDPQKLPPTILSRCLQFNLKRMPVDLIQSRLSRILDEENVPYDETSLKYLAQAADGSMRDGLSLLDQAIAYCEGQLKAADVAAMLGYISREPIYDIIEALQHGDAAALLTAAGALEEAGADYAAALDDLLSVLQQVALLQWVPDATDAVAATEDLERLQSFARGIDPEDVQLYYQIALLGKRDLPLSPVLRRGFEMVLLRMCAFRPAGGSEPRSNSGSSPLKATAGRDTAPALSAKPARKPVDTKATAKPDPAALVAGAESVSQALSWHSLYQALDLKGMVAELAANCDLQSWEGDTIKLVLSEQHAQLYNTSFENRLNEAVSAYLGRAVRLTIEAGSPVGETPAGEAARLQSERQQAAVEAIESDRLVQAFKEKFDARVQEDSIRPVD